MKTKTIIEYRTKIKTKTKITISKTENAIKLAHKDIEFENEIVLYAIALRNKLLSLNRLSGKFVIKVNYINGEVFRYRCKPTMMKYDNEVLRNVMECK